MAEEERKPEEGEEQDEDEIQYKHAKDAVLFTIEVSQSMKTSPPPDANGKVGDSPLMASLKCAYELMTQRIISNPNDTMGILLYGTEVTKGPEDQESSSGDISCNHTYLLADLDVPSIQDVKAIKDLIEDPQEFEKVAVPAQETVTLTSVLFYANQIFTTRAGSFNSRRLFLVTDNDNPHKRNKKENSTAATRAKDLYELGVVIELFPVTKPGEDFDRTRFYNDIMYSTVPSDPDAPASLTKAPKTSQSGHGLSLFAALLSSIRSKAVPKRALFANLPLELGPDLRISVKGYIIFKRQEKQKAAWVWLGGEETQLVKPVSTKLTEDAGKPIEKPQIRKAYKFGGAQISFTVDEMAAIRNFGEPGIRIIGFKPHNRDTLPIWANCKISTFLYPSEEGYVGSTRVFAALQQKLKRAGKMAIAWFIARKNAAPSLVAIVPGDERLNEDGDQIVPEGMWLIPLPYADDVRKNPETKMITAPDTLIDKMREIMRHLQLSKGQYDPEKYPNPDLQNHYRVLQGVALDEDPDEWPEMEDKTIPKYKGIHRRAGEFILDWGDELHEQHRLWEEEHQQEITLPKRPLSSADDGGPKKKAKSIASDQGLGDDEMKAHFDKQSIGKLTVPVLKAFLTDKSMSTSGKKADLVGRVEEYFEQKA